MPDNAPGGYALVWSPPLEPGTTCDLTSKMWLDTEVAHSVSFSWLKDFAGDLGHVCNI